MKIIDTDNSREVNVEEAVIASMQPRRHYDGFFVDPLTLETLEQRHDLLEDYVVRLVTTLVDSGVLTPTSLAYLLSPRFTVEKDND